jgi:hypothetical protein
MRALPVVAMALSASCAAAVEGAVVEEGREVKLQRFEVIAGKEERFEEWMSFLRQEHAAVVLTLEREKMYFEAIFSEKVGDTTYAYWLTFKGTGGSSVESSEHEVDRKHLEFFDECIRMGSRRVLSLENHFVPARVDEAIARGSGGR